MPRVNRHGMPGFTEFFVRGLHDEGQVGVAWGGQFERVLQQDLPSSAEQQVSSTHHVGDMLRSIVDDYGKLVGNNLVLAPDYNIAELRRAERARSLYFIVKKNHRPRGNPETHCGWNAGACWSRAARPGITGFFIALQLA